MGIRKENTPFYRWENTYIQTKDIYKAKADCAHSLMPTVQATRKKDKKKKK